MAHDLQTYRRGQRAALVGFVLQVLLVIAAWLAGRWTESPGLAAVSNLLISLAIHLSAGLVVWAAIWLLYFLLTQERGESLEAERLGKGDAKLASMFEEHAAELQVARKRIASFTRWGLPVVSLLAGAFLLIVGLMRANAAWKAWAATGPQAPVSAPLDSTHLAIAAAAAAAAFLLFIVARYLSGMTQVNHWQSLRGGAGYAIGSAIACLLVLAGGIAIQFFRSTGVPFLRVALPSYTALTGLVILLTFLLDLYRPKRPDEQPRAAFDTPLLAWLTRPEALSNVIGKTIHYQFGVEVSRSWFFGLMSRAVAPLFLIGLLIIWLLSCLVFVGPSEQAIITFNGKLVASDASGQAAFGPGLHFKWPWPLGRAYRKEVGKLQQISVGSAEKLKADASILWTNSHAVDAEQYLLTNSPSDLLKAISPSPAPARDSAAPPATAPAQAGAANVPPAESSNVNFSLIGVQIVVQYRIKDLAAYARVSEPDRWNDATASATDDLLLKAMVERRASSYIAMHELDSLLGPGQTAATTELRRLVQQDADASAQGVEIVFVGFFGAHPPMESNVAQAFHKQIAARLEYERQIEKARQTEIETLARAAGSPAEARLIDTADQELRLLRAELEQLRAANNPQADRITDLQNRLAARQAQADKLLEQSKGELASLLLDAHAYAWSVVLGEQSRAEDIRAQVAGFKASPKLFTARRYYSSLAAGMAPAKKIIIASQMGDHPVIRIDLTDKTTGLEALVSPRR